MARQKKEKAAAVQATADYILSIIDEQPWQQRMDDAAFCRNCPARQGGVLDADSIDHLCAYCPLRPYMMALAEIVLRQRRKGDLK